MDWEIVIGLETHVQLSTESKIFSDSSTRFGAAPNTQANVMDMALPGSLPVMNRGAVERAILFGLAVDGHIAPRSQFERYTYQREGYTPQQEETVFGDTEIDLRSRLKPLSER